MITLFQSCGLAGATVTGYVDSTGTWDSGAGIFTADVVGTDPGAPYAAESVALEWTHDCGGYVISATFGAHFFVQLSAYIEDTWTVIGTAVSGEDLVVDTIPGAEPLPCGVALELLVGADAIGHAEEIEVSIGKF